MTDARKDLYKPDGGSYAENAAITDLIGTHPKAKILASLLSTGTDVTITQLSELAGVGRTTVYRYLEPMVDLGVVEASREVGNSTFYQLNQDSEVAEKLASLEWALLDEYEQEEGDR